MAGRRGETGKRITERRSSPKEKSPCAFTADGDARHSPRGTMVLRGIFLRSGTNSRGAYAPPVRVFSSSPTKKPPERRDGGRKGDDQGLRLRRKTLRCARVRTAGALTPRRFASSVLRQQKNRLKGRTAEGGEMIRACACGAKLFAALGYEQPGRLRPAGPPFQFSANKKNRLKGRTAEGGEMIRACACGAKLASRVRTAGALTPRRFASSVLRQQKNRLKGGFFCWWR